VPDSHGLPVCKGGSLLQLQQATSVSTRLDMWWHTAPADPCLDQQYHSSCQLQDVMAGDLESPGQLERVANLRSWNKEIIFTSVNAVGTKLAINWVLSLRAQGIDHVFVITDSPAHCKAMFYSDARISCGWTSFLFQYSLHSVLRRMSSDRAEPLQTVYNVFNTQTIVAVQVMLIAVACTSANGMPAKGLPDLQTQGLRHVWNSMVRQPEQGVPKPGPPLVCEAPLHGTLH
jgi:hypothetical protein